MISSAVWTLRKFARRLWVRVSLITALAVFTAALSPLSAMLPFQLQVSISEEDLRDLLEIITNSMLAVTTFSLSIMVTAHLSADKGVTPRSHRLLQEDGRTQTVLATFIGAFIYALTLTVILNAGFIVEADYALIYFVTVGVIVFVVAAIMRWIAHLDGLGSVELTARRVEERAQEQINAMNEAPFLGGRALTDPDSQIPPRAEIVRSDRFGWVQNIGTERLSKRMVEGDGQIYLAVRPGDWVETGSVLAHVAMPGLDGQTGREFAACVTIGDVRAFDQDTAFGLIVLTEIAERALSPGINDPRTALDIVSRLTRLIARIEPQREMDDPPADRVHVAPMDHAVILDATLDRIARDGRAFVEVQLACQQAYAALVRHSDADIRRAAQAMSRRGLAYAENGLIIEDDLRRVRAAAPRDRAGATTA